MTLIVGLGNPSDKYKNNRHNIGFMVVDELIDDLLAKNISKSSFKGELYKKGDIFLLKPFTYMNLSGQSVLAVSRYFKISKIIVIHDDLDIELGRIKVKFAGSSGGHNGLKSIDSLVSNSYERIRIGISRPLNRQSVVSYVLSDFSKDELPCVQKVIKKAACIAKDLIKSNIKEIQNRYPSKENYCK